MTVPFLGKGDLEGGNKLGTLQGGHYPGLSGGSRAIVRILLSGRQVCLSGNEEVEQQKQKEDRA